MHIKDNSYDYSQLFVNLDASDYIDCDKSETYRSGKKGSEIYFSVFISTL
jgi:hypothetical protein